MTATQSAAPAAPRGAAERLVLAGRFAALAYLNFLVWLSVWVLVPMIVLGWTPMAVESGSMGPVIRAGDVVLIAPYGGEPLTAGKIVTFDDPAEPGRIVTHRVTGVGADGTYQTKGDANLDADSTPLPAENIRGVGKLIVPRVGLPVIWLQQQRYPLLVGWVLSVVLAIVLLAPAKPADGAPAPAPASRPARAAKVARPAKAVRPARAPRVRRGAAPALPVPPQHVPPQYLPWVPGSVMAPATPLPPPPAPVWAAPAAPATPFQGLLTPPAPAALATVPPVRYRVSLPAPPAALDLPAPPRWTVSAVPPAPGTAPVAPIPPPPRPAAVRRGSALGTRTVPGWSGRLHAVLLVLALTGVLGLGDAAAAPPAEAAFSSTHHAIVANTGNSFTADRLNPVSNLTISAPLAACRINIGWTHSSSAWRSGYRVYRALNGDANYTLLATLVPGQGTYTDDAVTSSTITYYYRVVSYRATNWESVSNGEVHAAPSLAGCGS